MPFEILFQVQFGSCVMMVAIIWTIQILHYPSFFYIDELDFSEFHNLHSYRITWIVAPLMSIELVTAISVWYFSQNSIWFGFNLVSVIIIWVVTFFVSVPIHNHLAKGKDQKKIQLLISTNWIRTIFWTIRLFLLVFLSLK
ncbi:hypothetical protein AB3N60_05320 [Leptospira sp. WS39.C2]